MSAEAIARAFEADLPFVGLRDHDHDPDLDRVVPPDAARAARALPLSADAAHVRVAVADPGVDLSALSPYLEGRRVELVIAAREELDAVLGPPVAAAPEPASAAPAQPLPREPAPLPPEPEPLAPDSSLGEPPRLSPESAVAATSTGSEEEVAGQGLAASEPEGEEPSWLQTPRRRGRRAVATLLVLLLLIVAAGAVAAYLLAR
ncbi:MAG TPA: hypothetical protein VKB54_22195 [Solirubrobacteraceae bacterium]|nr:hypothetical protein [Solirubrobacteraceae bacterium]